MAQFSNSVIANLTDNYKVSCFWVRMMASAYSKCSALHRLWSSTCRFGIPRKVVGFCTSKRLVYSETRGFVSSCLTLITLHGSKSHYWIVVVTRWASTVIIHIDSPVVLRQRSTSLVTHSDVSAMAVGWSRLWTWAGLLKLTPLLQGMSARWLERWKEWAPLVVSDTNGLSCICQRSFALYLPLSFNVCSDQSEKLT